MIAIRPALLMLALAWNATAQTNRFTIGVGDAVSNGAPGPGAGNIESADALDFYTFTNAPGQRVFFDSFGTTANIYWQVLDSAGHELFNWHFNSGDPGAWTLPVAGTNTIKVYGTGGAVGTYGFKLWGTPPSQQFSVSIDQSVSDGVPAPGAGNLETVGAVDDYTFTNAPSQRVFFDSFGTSGNVFWRVLDAAGHELFNWHFNSGDPGPWTLPIAGTNKIHVYQQGDSFGTYGFRMWTVPAPQSFTTAIDQPVSDGVPAPGAGNIESPGAVDYYTFTNAAGQRVFFDSFGTTSTIFWQVLDAAGNELFNWHFNSGDPGVWTLPVAGVNTIRVYGQGEARGTYGFKIWTVPAGEQFNIAIGDTVSDGVPAPGAGRLESPGARDTYTFTNAAGQNVFFDSFGTDATIFWQVLDRNGAELFNWHFNSGDPGTLILPQAGTNTIRVYGQGEARGTYGFKLWNVPAADQFVISIGSTVSNGSPAAGAGNIESPGARDLYTFTNAAGQRVFFHSLGATATIFWQVLDRNGNELFNRHFNSGDPGSWYLPQAGTNTIRVYGSGDNRGTYGFALVSTNDPSAITNQAPPADRFTIAIGDTVTNGVPGVGAGNIEALGVQDQYTFTANAGQSVFFEDLGAERCCLDWYLYDPDGAFIFGDRFDGGDPGRRTFSKTGVYRIVAMAAGADPSWIGSYSFRLRSVPADESFNIAIGMTVTNGVPASGAGNLEAAGSVDNYTFYATAGSRLYFEDLGAERCCMDWYVYDPDGGFILGDRFDGGDPGRRILSKTGLYRIVVMAAGAEPSWVGSYSFRITTIPPDEYFNIPIGLTVTNGVPASGAGNLESAASQDIYTFYGVAGTTLYFEDFGAERCCLDWYVYDPDGGFVLGDRFDGGDPGRRVLAKTGPYTIRVMAAGAEPSWVGSYSFRVRSLADDQQFNISIGDTVTNGVPASGAGNLEQAGVLDIYRFYATAGTAVYFQDLGAERCCLDWYMYDPDGGYIGGDRLDGNGWDARVLNKTGQYMIQVMAAGAEPSWFGNYSFRLWSANPEIVAQPQPQSQPVGNTAHFNVVARYPTALTYQWRLNGTNVAGGTNASLALPNLQLSQAGDYSVVVSATYGSVTSAVAPLTVISNPACLFPPAGIAAWWPGGNGAADLVGTNNGTLQNGATFTNGFVGQAFFFDGANDYVDFGTWFNLQTFTIALWVNPRASQQTYADIMDNNHTDFRSWVIQYDNTGLQFHFGANGIGGVTFNLVADTWQFLVVTVDPNHQIRVYLDSQLIGTSPAGSAITYDGSQFLRLSAWGGGGRHFNGLMDEVTIYNRALASNEIAAIYAAGSAGECTAPAPPAIFTQPTNVTVLWGESASFVVSAQSLAQPTYRWYFNNALIPGESQPTLLRSNAQPSQAGNYFVTISNVNGSVTSSVAVLTVISNVPDLVVRNLGTPASADAGQPVPLVWRSANEGTATASSPWRESVLFADNPQMTNAQELLGFTAGNPLAAGASVMRTQTVILPAGRAGNFWLGVQIDSLQQVREGYAESNNLTVATATTVVSAPDLVVPSVSVGASALFGGNLSVTWVVRNAGSAIADAAWFDHLALSADQILGGDTSLALPAALRTLAAGASYTNTAMVTLPLSHALPPGGYYILVTADATAAQAEFNENNNTAASGAVTLSFPPLPDLAVQNIRAFDSGGAPLSNALPGQLVSVVWQTTNGGTAAAGGPWRESILLSEDNAIGNDLSLLTLFATNPIPAGGSVTRTQSVAIPITTPTGSLRFVVAADSADEVFESNEQNNQAMASNAFSLAPQLTLQLPASEVAEGAAMTQGTITRNGDRSQPLTVALSNSQPAELRVPTNVVIAAGQASASFNVEALTDGVVDGPRSVTVSARAVGFPMASASLVVLDIDVPRLFLQFASGSVNEGLTVAATVRRELLTSNALAVALSSSSPSQLQVPASVTIPANASNVTFAVLAVDDSLIEDAKTYTVTAGAGGFASDSAQITVNDNDVPAIQISLAQTNVSEAAGPQATFATIARNPISSRALLIELESSNTNAVLVPLRVSVPAGEASVSFPVAAVNNNQVDGPKPALIRGYVVDSTTGARFGAPAVAALTVSDDDGPTLTVTLARKLVGEGLNPATTATVSRNTGTNGNLLVALSSSDTTEATVPPNVTIANGQSSATFNIATVNDGITDGNQPAIITATAGGYTAGSDVLVVSDANIPDLAVTSVEVPPSATTETYATIRYRISNQGLAAAGTNWLTRIFLSRDALVGDDILVGQYAFNGTIPVGLFFEQTLSILMPRSAGDYWLVVQTDVENVIHEGLEDNNTGISATPIHVGAAYRAVVQTDIETAPAGTPIPMHGQAFRGTSNDPAPEGQFVNVHILVRGTRRIISALTDANGNFSLTWQPLAGEAGSYQIGAAHPGDATAPVQDTFTLLGMKADPGAPTVRVNEGQTVMGTVRLQNLSDLPLSGLAASVASKPSNLNVGLNLSGGGALAGLGEVMLTYTITATDASVLQGTMTVHLTTTQGATLDIPVAVTVEPLRSRLVANPSELVRGMKRGVQTVIQFELVNQGSIASGPITMYVPEVPWLSLVSTNPASSLAPGETNKVLLQLSPASDLPLGDYQGTMTLAASNDTVLVPFKFRALSEAKGDLKITTVDEYTYYAVGSPRVTNAAVSIRDAISGLLVTNGATGAMGELLVPALMEGYYEIEATAPSHVSYRATVLLVPGITNELTAFLSRETVLYTWTVEPTEIEDRYKITIESTFETVVPTPVVTIEPALIDLAEITADVTQIEIKISNHGLIAAQNMHVSFPTHPQWEFTPLLEDIGALPAQSSLTIPLTIRRLGGSGGDAARAKGGPKAGGACSLSANVCWELICGPFKNKYCGGIFLANTATGCGGAAPVPVGGGGGGGGSIVVFSGPAASVKIVCDPRCLILAGLGCIPGPIGCFFSGFTCGEGLQDPNLPTSVAITDCAVGIAGCLIPGAGIPACIYALTRCFIQPASPDASKNAPLGQLSFSTGGAKALSSETDALAPYRSEIRSMLDAFNEITGAPDGVWLNAGAGSATGDWWARFQSAVDPGSPGGRNLSPSEQASLASAPLPPGVNVAEVSRFLARWNRTMTNWNAGIFSRAQTPNGQSSDFIDGYLLRTNLVRITDYQHMTAAAGFTDPFNAVVESLRAREAAGQAGGVCARVKIRIEQEAVLTRSAFRATLEIENNAATPVEGIGVELRITDAGGRDATAFFGTRSVDLTALTAINGTGVVAPVSSGSARWILVPTHDAAPDAPVQYYVGGTLRYMQDGVVVTIPLAPAGIIVRPDPRLVLQYFHQRDVFSDDPFTPIVEPSIPFSLALLVRNDGKGDAHNLRITSAQPEIVENDKGLLIDFKIIGTEVAGQNITPSLTADLGDIPVGQNKIARWLLTSTLQGLFINYSATVEHLDAIDGRNTALIDDISIHELTHIVRAGGAFEDGKPDFLVNDFPDAPFDLPDTLYLSDGRTNHVEVVTNGVPGGVVSAGNLSVQLTALMPGGWAYLRLLDPGNGQFRLKRVLRSDGGEIPVGVNAWTTDRTFIGLGRRPRNENILHLLDYNSTGIYTLEYEPQSVIDTVAPVSTVAGLPAASYSRIPVSWSGTDAGGLGIASFDIFVSINGGAFSPWLQDTRDMAATYLGTFGNSYAFYSVATDFAGNREAAPTAPQAQTTVSRTNSPPVIGTLPVLTLNEGQTLSFDIPASDPEGDTLTFSVVGAAPAGLQLNPASGHLSWVTGEGDGPNTNHITLQVLDSGTPRYGTTRVLTIVVNDVNTPPFLAPIANRTINEGFLLLITNVASDVDSPAQTLSFQLGPGAPAGAAIDLVTGVFSWRPSSLQGGTTNRFSAVVRDNGTPSLSTTQQFTVIVRDTVSDFALSIGSTNVFAGQTASVPVRVVAGVDLAQIRFLFRSTPPELTNRVFQLIAPQLASAVVEPAGNDSFQVTLNSQAGQPFQGNLDLMNFLLGTTSNSAIAFLQGSSVEATSVAGATLRNPNGALGRIFVIARQPLFDAQSAGSGNVTLAFYARPGSRHRIEYTSNLSNPASWQLWADVTAAQPLTRYTVPASSQTIFWRAVEIAPAP